jgi:PPM family protein phosphatase
MDASGDQSGLSSCRRCEAESAPESRFCESCGAPMAVTAAPAAVEESADPPTRPVGDRRRICRCAPDITASDAEGVCQICRLRVAWPQDEPNLVLAIDADLAALSDRGRRYRRSGMSNQDSALAARLSPSTALLAVADGVSQSNCPGAASAAALTALRAAFEESSVAAGAGKTAMRKAIAAAQAAVLAVPVARPDPRKSPPETTIAAALVRNGRATIGWVGDSRAYVVDGRSGKVLTQDDSWLCAVVEAGIMTAEAARADRRAHAITQCLGLPDSEIEIHVAEVRIDPGAWLVLCTDGLWNYLEGGSDLAGALSELPETADAIGLCRRVSTIANQRGGHDNISVAMLRVAPAAAGPAATPRRSRRGQAKPH